MRKVEQVFSVIAVFCLLIALLPSVKAHEDGLVVVLVTDKSIYGTGDEIEATVHVMHNGQYVDPDQIPIVLFDLESYDYEYMKVFDGEVSGREYPAQKVSTGIYRANIELFDSDTESSGYASIYLKPYFTADNGWEDILLTYGRSSEEDTTYDYAHDYSAVYVSIIGGTEETGLCVEYSFDDISGFPWGPGDRIDITANVKNDDNLVKPDELSVTNWDDDDVPYNNPSTGVYEISYQIPSSIDENEDAGIMIGAYIEEGELMDEIAISIPVVLYQIWYHALPAPNGTTIAFEVCVADAQGDPVSGATVGIETYDAEWDEMIKMTDGSGKASFVIPASEGEIDIEGWVKDGSKNQSFWGSIPGSETSSPGTWEPEPDGYGFEILLRPGSGDTRECYAFMDGEPMEGEELYYYVYTSREVVSKGLANPGDGGMFTIPAKITNAFEAEVLFVAPQGYHPSVFEGYGWEDTDGDGFSDKFEDHIGTDKNDEDDYPSSYSDSDYDGFGDEFEEHVGTDPFDNEDHPSSYKDSDYDGWGDEFEIENGTDPDSYIDDPGEINDTDGDDHDDDEEVFYGTSPEDAEDFPHDIYQTNSDGTGWFSNDRSCDLEEEFYGTDPENASDYPRDIYDVDSDWDGVCDPEEEFYGTNPEDYEDTPDYEPNPWDDRYSDHNSTDGKRYVREDDYISGSGGGIGYDFDDDSIDISVDDLKVGGVNIIDVGGDIKPGYMGVVFVGDLDDIKEMIESEGEAPEEWSLWEPDPTFPIVRTKNGWKGLFVLPDFLPGDQKITVLVGSILEDEESMSFNHVTVKKGGSASTSENEKALPMTAIIAGVAAVTAVAIILIMIAIFLIVFAKSRKKKDTSS